MSQGRQNTKSVNENFKNSHHLPNISTYVTANSVDENDNVEEELASRTFQKIALQGDSPYSYPKELIENERLKYERMKRVTLNQERCLIEGLRKREELSLKQKNRIVKAEHARKLTLELKSKYFEKTNRTQQEVSARISSTRRERGKKNEELASKYRSDFLSFLNKQRKKEMEKSFIVYNRSKELSKSGFAPESCRSCSNNKDPNVTLFQLNTRLLNADKLAEKVRTEKVQCASVTRRRVTEAEKCRNAYWSNLRQSRLTKLLSKYQKMTARLRRISQKTVEDTERMREKNLQLVQKAQERLQTLRDGEERRMEEIEQRRLHKLIVSKSILEEKEHGVLVDSVKKEKSFAQHREKWKEIIKKNRDDVLAKHSSKNIIMERRQRMMSYRREMITLFKQKTQEELRQMRRFNLDVSANYTISTAGFGFANSPEAIKKKVTKKE